MDFLTIGEKIRRLRQQLNIEQDTLTQIGVSRNFISMLENNKRELTQSRALQITELLRKIAKEKKINIDITDDYLMLTPIQEAINYCLSSLDDVKVRVEADAIYEIIKSYNLDSVKPKYYLTLADIFFEEKNYTDAFIYYLDALDSYKGINNYLKTPYIYNRLGRCRDLKLDYSEGLSYFIKAYETSIHYNDEKIKKISLYNIAWCSYNLNKLEDSLEYINHYLEICNIDNSFNDYVRAIILKASCYVKKEDTQAAVKLYSDTIKLFKDLSDPMLGYIYNNIGEISMNLQMTDHALEYFEKAKSLREKYDIERISHTLICKARLYIQINDYNEALLQVVQAIAYSKSFKDNEYLFKGYTILETIYNHSKNYKKLMHLYYDMLSIINDGSNKELVMKIHAKLSIIDIKSNNIDKCIDHLENIVNM